MRVGFETELYGPSGSRRLDLAHCLAARLGGRLEYGFNMMESVPGSGRVIFELAPAYHLYDGDGRWQLSLVDDYSIKNQIEHADPHAGSFRLLSREAPVASWIVRFARSEASLAGALDILLQRWGLEVGEEGEETEDPDERIFFDGMGVPVAARSSYHGGRERVVELVTRPLEVDERLEVVGPWLELARDQGFAPASDGALHLHFDRDPWMRTAALRALVLGWNARRDELLRAWEPRQESPKWRGAFSAKLVELVAASQDSTPFIELARAIRELDPPKTLDWNIRNVVTTRPRRPTLEARMWNAAVDLDRLETAFQTTVAFLKDLDGTWPGHRR